MTHNWQHPDWPNFTYAGASIASALYSYAQEAGRIAGNVSELEPSLQSEAHIDLMVAEAIKSSAIEGERLDREDVRSSIKNHIGLSVPPTRVANPKAEGIAALMVSVRQSFQNPMDEATLFDWHSMVLPQGRDTLGRTFNVGAYRADAMEIVSGPIGYEQVHFTAPPAEQVPAEMRHFLDWYNRTSPYVVDSSAHLPGPVRAAVAHLWLSSIHPFDDGNGRLCRALSEHALAQDLNRPPLLSLSSAIEADRKGYYRELHQASQCTLDISSWVEWFTIKVDQAQAQAVNQVEFVLGKSRFWNRFEGALNERQEKVVRKMFDAGVEGFKGGMSAKKYASITKCSKATATRDLTNLLHRGCFSKLPGVGRSTRYELATIEPVQPDWLNRSEPRE